MNENQRMIRVIELRRRMMLIMFVVAIVFLTQAGTPRFRAQPAPAGGV